MPSVGPATADSMDKALGYRRRLAVSPKLGRKRVCSAPRLAWQWRIHDPAYRLSTTTCMSRSAGVDSLRSEPCGFEAPFSMHDIVCRLRRIPLPRTPVNKEPHKLEAPSRSGGCSRWGWLLPWLEPQVLEDLRLELLKSRWLSVLSSRRKNHKPPPQPPTTPVLSTPGTFPP
jgi:hypothetical protein